MQSLSPYVKVSYCPSRVSFNVMQSPTQIDFTSSRKRKEKLTPVDLVTLKVTFELKIVPGIHNISSPLQRFFRKHTRLATVIRLCPAPWIQ